MHPILKRKNSLQLFAIILVVLCYEATGYAKTIYMGPAETYTTLKSAFAAMSGGDTLIIRDGTYQGMDNQIRYNNKPPSGSVDSYSIIKAENNGNVVFDGQDTLVMFDGTGTFTMSYIHFEGLQFINGEKFDLTGKAHDNRTAHHIKFLSCGFENKIQIGYASYVLMEDCYVAGKGRYNFATFVSDHIIFRRCIARLDAADGGGFPISHFVNYASQFVEFQNCIAIDSDDTYYSNYEGIYGGFYIRKSYTIGVTTYSSTDTSIRGCITLNVKHDTSGVSSPAESLAIGYGASNLLIQNSVWWDIGRGMQIDNAINNNFIIKNSTFGKSTIDSTSTNRMIYATGLYGDVSNSIFYQINNIGTGIGYALDNVKSSNNNIFYENEVNKNNITNTSGDTIDLHPLSIGLKYLLRPENDSLLESKGAGAVIIKRIGESGSLYDEPNYNTETQRNLWPWPNEKIIRTFFRNQGSITNPLSTRGFCADNTTLTKYIWEYLGNTIPAEIYLPAPITSWGEVQ